MPKRSRDDDDELSSLMGKTSLQPLRRAPRRSARQKADEMREEEQRSKRRRQSERDTRKQQKKEMDDLSLILANFSMRVRSRGKKSMRKSHGKKSMRKSRGKKSMRKSHGKKSMRKSRGKKSMRKSRGKRSSRAKLSCQSKLKNKIKINMAEYKKGKFSSRQQALAVSYAQVGKKSPSCKKYFKKSRK